MKMNWKNLVTDIGEKLLLNQDDMATRISVTQQTISNWMTGARSPGLFPRDKLRELAQEAGLRWDSYKEEEVMLYWYMAVYLVHAGEHAAVLYEGSPVQFLIEHPNLHLLNHIPLTKKEYKTLKKEATSA